MHQFDGTVGKRFLEGNKLGTASCDWNGRGIDDVEPGPFFVGGGYDIRDYQYYRSRAGYAGTIDYRFSDTSSIPQRTQVRQ